MRTSQVINAHASWWKCMSCQRRAAHVNSLACILLDSYTVNNDHCETCTDCLPITWCFTCWCNVRRYSLTSTAFATPIQVCVVEQVGL